MPYVQSITDVLFSHLGFHRSRLKFMARFTSAVLSMTTTNLKGTSKSYRVFVMYLGLRFGVWDSPNSFVENVSDTRL
jgi:hypothetical protein